jgi:hypothetical protein
MLMCYGALLLFDRLQRTTESARTSMVAAAAVAVAAAYLIRTIGILIFPAAFLASVASSKRVMSSTTAALGAAAVIMLLVQRTFPTDLGTYVGYFHNFGLHSLVLAVEHYARVGGSLFGQPVARVPALAALLGLAFASLVIVGFVARLRRRISVFEWFFVGYGLFLLIYPITIEVSRYSLPLWPLLFLYCATGIAAVMQTLDHTARRALCITSCAVVVGIYLAQYATLDAGPIPHSVNAPQSVALFEAIRRDVQRDAAVLARKPTIVALYGERRAAIWGQDATDDDLWSYIAQQKVRYLLQEQYPVIERIDDENAPLNAFIQHNRSLLTPVFKDDWFILYRVR